MHGSSQPAAAVPIVVGRYAIYDAIALGGTATVHLGRLVGPPGIAHTVAVKRIHPQIAQDPDRARSLLDEARLAARIQHPNIVSTLDVVHTGHEMLLVVEYINGESLSRLTRALGQHALRLPPDVGVAILLDVLAGLHAVHEASDECGETMGLVHRDVSPENVLVGVDGVARLDFGIAKALTGKVMYMPKEQIAGKPLTRRTDIYACGVILHETLTGTRMFPGHDDVAAVSRIMAGDFRVPSEIDSALAAFDPIVRRAVATDPAHRYATARAMAQDLAAACPPAFSAVVGEWVQRTASEELAARGRRLGEIERSPAPMPDAFRESPSGHVMVMPPAAPVAPPTKRGLGPRLIAVLVVLLALGAIAVAAIFGVRMRHPPSAGAIPTASSGVAASPPLATSAEPAPPPSASTSHPKCEPPSTIDRKRHTHFTAECSP